MFSSFKTADRDLGALNQVKIELIRYLFFIFFFCGEEEEGGGGFGGGVCLILVYWLVLWLRLPKLIDDLGSL